MTETAALPAEVKPAPKSVSKAYQLLTIAEQLFVDQMVMPGVHSRCEAMRRARPDLKCPEQAAALAWKKPLVRAAVFEIRAADAARAGITREQLLREYATIGLYTPIDEPPTMAHKLHALDSIAKIQQFMNAEGAGAAGSETLESLILKLPPMQVNVQVNVEQPKP